MSEKQKSGLLWIISGILLVVMIVSILLTTPAPFAAIIEPSVSVDTSTPEVIDDGTFNINVATREQWFSLEGMNATIYLGICEKLEEKTAFHTVEELLEIDGITQKLLDVWYDRLWCA